MSDRLTEHEATGLEYLNLVTKLLHRVRLADQTAGLWEAADLQWWWRKPRRSDEIGQTFWLDGSEPVAAVIFTDWGRGWGCDPIVSADASESMLHRVWNRALARIDSLALDIEVAVRDDHGEIASYGLFWSDPVTAVGMVEPMRTEEKYLRLGLARFVLASGLERLALLGSRRLKVYFEADNIASPNLYLSAGFRPASTSHL